MIKAIWFKLASLCSYLYLRLHGYKTWSNIYRFVWERKYRDVKISTFASLQLTQDFMRGGSLWVSDSWKELFDAISSAGRAQQIFAGIEPKPVHGLDCDDHAVFLVASIQKGLVTGVLKDAVSNPKFFTVMWFENWTPLGHNVCLLEVPSVNWVSKSPRYCYMDYGLPSEPCDNIQEVADQVRKKYSKASAQLTSPLTWCVSSEDLTPEICHMG